MREFPAKDDNIKVWMDWIWTALSQSCFKSVCPKIAATEAPPVDPPSIVERPNFFWRLGGGRSSRPPSKYTHGHDYSWFLLNSKGAVEIKAKNCYCVSTPKQYLTEMFNCQTLLQPIYRWTQKTHLDKYQLFNTIIKDVAKHVGLGLRPKTENQPQDSVHLIFHLYSRAEEPIRQGR